MQRRNLFPGDLCEMGDLAEFRVHAGGEDHRLAFTRHQGGAGQQNIPTVEQEFFAGRLRVAPLRKGFPGHGGIVDPQGECLDETAIGGYAVTLLEQDDVAGHQFAGKDQADLAVPYHFDRAGQEFEQSGERSLRPVLLPERK